MEGIILVVKKIGEIDPQKLENADLLNFIISLCSLFVAALSLIISLILLGYSIYQFFLKAGYKFHGAFAISSSVWSKQSYISEIILENSKDKVAVISSVYVRLGSNIYVELIDYADSPKIVGPFETLKIVLRQGVSGYIASSYKVDVGKLLADRKVKREIFIATPKGIVKVKKYKRVWNVYIESLRNSFIVPVKPVRKYYSGKEYSDALQYVVVDENNGGDPVEIFLYRKCSYKIGELTINTDDFAMASDLEMFLTENASASGLKVKSVGYNYRDYEFYEHREIDRLGFFWTHVVGNLYTRISGLVFRFKSFRKR